MGQGEVGGCTALADSAWWLLQLAIERAWSAVRTALADSAWRLLQLAIERAWSALDGPFLCFLVQTRVENGAFTLYGLHFWLLGSFQSGGAFSGRKALTIECSVMSGCGQGHEPAKNL